MQKAVRDEQLLALKDFSMGLASSIKFESEGGGAMSL